MGQEENDHKVYGLGSEIRYVDVCTQPDVVGEIPAVMVRVAIDHDVVAVPQPVIYKIVFRINPNLPGDSRTFLPPLELLELYVF
jgi:hypothetical protein